MTGVQTCALPILTSIPIVAITATVTFTGSTILCLGDTLKFTANSGTGYTYQWQLNSVNIVGATNIAYGATKAGAYRVLVTNAIGCSAISKATTVTVNTCARESNGNLVGERELEITIYPNPTNDAFFIENLSQSSEKAYFKIHDLSGRIIESGQIDFSNGVGRFGEKLATGIYIFEAESDGGKKIFMIDKTSE